MKRKFAWLMLPVSLCALAWGLKWRADHPTPTKLDLEARVLMLEASDVEVGHLHRDWRKQKKYDVNLSQEDLEALTQWLYILPQPIKWNQMKMRSNGAIAITCPVYRANEKKGEALGVSFQIPVDEFDGREGRAFMSYLGRNIEYNLHPITTKRWLELLFNHPKIGPELRRRLKR